jgi:hypothetical protein
MSWRKKIGWRGPLSDPVSTIAGAVVESHVHPSARGPDDGELAMDVARVGPPDADALLVVSSATHGVEGFCGSGIQVALLGDPAVAAALASSGAALLLVHAVNPYGFAHVRRTNAEPNAGMTVTRVHFIDPGPAATSC